GEHLQKLIDDVLDLAKIESGHLELSIEPVGAYEELAQILRLMRPMARARGIDLALDEAGQNVVVHADRIRLRQAVLNFVSNAIKYNREQGAVNIACESCGEGRIRIRVSDTGIGIPAERQAELFLPFHRLAGPDSVVEGTGIGLAITRRLVEAMGGAVGFESRPEGGSIFWLELPLIESIRSAPLAASTQRDEELPRKEDRLSPARLRTILYIEDNPANLRLIEQLITRRPELRMLSAHEPRLGIELIAAHLPDVILLDLNLPELSGYELFERLQANPESAGIPVIAVTANAMQRDIERGRQAGFFAYLTKPLDVALFYATLDKALETVDRTAR
ncbi:MAG: ATP-binding protein, partial [Betaproteobacteria bacterium]|nr:ATP-binding protein [Betaproteobacteria bacterium]